MDVSIDIMEEDFEKGACNHWWWVLRKSTVDRILAFRVLIERRMEFRQPFFGAYVDFRNAFDSIHRVKLWELLLLRGIPEKILALVRALYTDTESAVRYGGGTSEIFSSTHWDAARMCPGSVPVQRLYGLDHGAHGQLKLSRGIVR